MSQMLEEDYVDEERKTNPSLNEGRKVGVTIGRFIWQNEKRKKKQNQIN